MDEASAELATPKKQPELSVVKRTKGTPESDLYKKYLDEKKKKEVDWHKIRSNDDSSKRKGVRKEEGREDDGVQDREENQEKKKNSGKDIKTSELRQEGNGRGKKTLGEENRRKGKG